MADTIFTRAVDSMRQGGAPASSKFYPEIKKQS